MIDPEVLKLRAAIGQAFDDAGVPETDEDLIEDFIISLKERGYIIMREINGVFPGEKK